MRSVAIAFLIGAALCQQLEDLALSAVAAGCVSIGCSLLAVRWRAVRALLVLSAGFFWAAALGQHALDARVAASSVGVDLDVQASVRSVPRAGPGTVRFVADLRAQAGQWSGDLRARLTWYNPPRTVRVGEIWRFSVRLREPSGFANPGIFDYEQWLFARGIGALGYVRGHLGDPQRAADGWSHLQRLRATIYETQAEVLSHRRFAGVIHALTVGLRDAVPQSQWEVLRDTGTAHLMAISGLHVGLVAAAGFALGGRAVRVSARLTEAVSATRAAAVGAVLLAVVYAGLAGFSLPTQRALIMVLVWAVGVLSRRHPAPSVQLAWAGLIIGVMDPFALVSPSAWLSFGAVGALLFVLAARVGQHSWWTRWAEPQYVVFVALAPLTLVAFDSVALGSIVANAVAVPWVSLVTVPLALLGTLALAIAPPVAQWLLVLAELSLVWLWPFLEVVGSLTTDLVAWPALTGFSVAGAITASVIVLMPPGLPGRWLAAVFAAGALWPRPPSLAPGEVHLHLLDVGQGLSAVLETRSKVLVYDMGASFGPRFDAGSAVLAPFLRSRGWTEVHVAVISHGDNDHRGGYGGLANAVPVARTISNVPGVAADLGCTAGLSWRWDEVEFTVRHPPRGWSSGENDGSCVLQVQSAGARVLLPGDLEAPGEQALVRAYGSALASEVLVAPHHGSATSSTSAFLDAVQPEVVLIPVGYRNRYRMPHPPVLERLAARRISVWETGRDGALSVILGRDGSGPVRAQRRDRRRYYQRRGSDEGRCPTRCDDAVRGR